MKEQALIQHLQILACCVYFFGQIKTLRKLILFEHIFLFFRCFFLIAAYKWIGLGKCINVHLWVVYLLVCVLLLPILFSNCVMNWIIIPCKNFVNPHKFFFTHTHTQIINWFYIKSFEYWYFLHFFTKLILVLLFPFLILK